MRPLLVPCALALLAACQSAPAVPLEPLPLVDRFPVSYEGRIAPIAADEQSGREEETVPLPVAGAAVSFRGTIVELPVAAARALAPGLVEPMRTGHGTGRQGGHADPKALREALDELAARGFVRSQPFTVARLGATAVTTMRTETPYVSALRIVGTIGPMVLDPEVEVFEHGSSLAFAAERDGDALAVSIEWLQTEPVLPVPVANAEGGSLQVPVFTRHRLCAKTRAMDHDALVVGVVPGREPGMVAMLCVQIDAGEVVATR
jgi:hypothetical protein